MIPPRPTRRIDERLEASPFFGTRVVRLKDQAAIEPLYERALMSEVDEILADVPHDRGARRIRPN